MRIYASHSHLPNNTVLYQYIQYFVYMSSTKWTSNTRVNVTEGESIKRTSLLANENEGKEVEKKLLVVLMMIIIIMPIFSVYIYIYLEYIEYIWEYEHTDTQAQASVQRSYCSMTVWPHAKWNARAYSPFHYRIIIILIYSIFRCIHFMVCGKENVHIYILI